MKSLKKLLSSGNFYGKLILLIGLLILVPLAVLPFYPEEARYALSFLIPAIFSIVLGTALCVLAPRKEERAAEWQSPLQKGSLPVLFAWCYGVLMGAFPFFISGKLSFIHSLFESVNGWSTAGFSIIDVTGTPHVFLFHRSFMQFCGGLGFIMMIVMLVQGKQAMNLYSAEGHTEKLMPNLRKTAQTVFLLYSGFLALGTLLYCIFGMSLFDAVCHAMSALSTAGYTTKAGSIGEFDSLAIEIVTIFLMLIGATNFAVLLLIIKRKFRQAFRASELRLMLALILIFVPLAALSLIVQNGMGIGEGLRNALFGVVSAISTTGYSISDYFQWPPFALGLITLLMIVGGSTGSTAGGLKLLRVHLLLKTTRESIRRRLSPARNVSAIHYYRAYGKTHVNSTLIIDTVGYIACYFGIIIAGSLLMTLTSGCSLTEAMFEFASAFGSAGISTGLTNADTPTGTLIIEMVGMLLGRLEIFIVFIGIYSGIRTLRQKIQRRFGK